MTLDINEQSVGLWIGAVVWWPEFLATHPEVPGSILGAIRYSE
jgi:hypothetical protein